MSLKVNTTTIANNSALVPGDVLVNAPAGVVKYLNISGPNVSGAYKFSWDSGTNTLSFY